MKNYENWKIEKVDLLVGGTPCQSFSVAGLRKGLSDPRGGLMLTYLEIAQRFSPQWIVWENVPGVLSANGGRAFGSFLGALGELGYGWAYRVMDAQWVRTHGHPHAVPQRRRRVFVVGYRGDFTRPAKVLFESQSLQRHSRSGEKEGKDIALHSQGSTGNGCWWDGSDCAGTLTKKNAGGDQRMPDKDNFGAILQEVDVAKCLAARSGTRNREDGDTYIPVPYDLFQITAPLNGQRREPGDPCHTLARDNASHAAIVGVDVYNQTVDGGVASTVTNAAGGSNTTGPKVIQTHMVRRLTPRECERLQGFPDDYTLIPWRGKPDCPDGHRYKALGNSMAVNCMEWIGERIQACDA
jgi:DNA (cytosine-5)-methyltransferase 1